MKLGAFGCMNNANIEKKIANDKIVIDVFIICQKLRIHTLVNLLYKIGTKQIHFDVNTLF